MRRTLLLLALLIGSCRAEIGVRVLLNRGKEYQQGSCNLSEQELIQKAFDAAHTTKLLRSQASHDTCTAMCTGYETSQCYLVHPQCRGVAWRRETSLPSTRDAVVRPLQSPEEQDECDRQTQRIKRSLKQDLSFNLSESCVGLLQRRVTFECVR